METEGIRNWALTPQKAITAIRSLEKMKIAILGGDVYEIINNRFTSTYENWYCNKAQDEDDNQYLVRSIHMARQYILNHQSNNKIIYFCLVPDIRENKSLPPKNHDPF